MNSSYFKSATHLSIIFIGRFFFFAICYLPFYFVYKYFYSLNSLKIDIIENSSFEHKMKQQREHEMNPVGGLVTEGCCD